MRCSGIGQRRTGCGGPPSAASATERAARKGSPAQVARFLREGRVTDAGGEVLYADDVAAHADVRVDGAWVDKGALVAEGARRAGAACLFHRIICRAPPGTPTRSAQMCWLAYRKGRNTCQRKRKNARSTLKS